MTPIQTTQTLRASCDACASSKVKCDKERPACRRCLSGGAECVYGVSRKHGKQPRRKRSMATADSKTVTDRLAPRVLVDSPSLRQGHFRPELDMGFEDVLHDIGISRGPPAIRSSEQDQYTLSTPESPIPDDEWSSFVDPAPFFPNYGQAGGRKQSYTSLESAYSLYETVTESTEHTRFLGDVLSGPSSGPSPSQGSSLSSASRGWRPPSIDHNQSPQHLRSPGNPISQQSTQHQQSQPHSCYNLASSALESLRLETRYVCSRKRALDGPSPSPLPILNLDHILEANKSALATLQQTMDCKCLERHAPLAFLHASIFSKVIFWYQVAGRIIRSAATPVKSQSRFVTSPNSALPDDCAHGRSRGTPTSSGFSPRTLESLSVSIGHFDVDAEDRATLSQHLLLSELRKAAALAERIQMRRGDSEYETFSTSDGDSSRDPSGILGNWIQAELARTIREVKTIPIAADGFDSNSDNFVRRQLLRQ